MIPFSPRALFSPNPHVLRMLPSLWGSGRRCGGQEIPCHVSRGSAGKVENRTMAMQGRGVYKGAG